MKAEDVERIYSESNPDDHWVKIDVYWEELSAEERQRMINFARACEQHGVERAKAGARLQDDPSRDDPHGGEFWFIDWSALDAEIAKENEDG